MPTIHHATIKSAAKQGIALEQAGDTVRAYCPRLNTALYNTNPRVALNEMIAVLFLKDTRDAAPKGGWEIIPEGDHDDDDHAQITLKCPVGVFSGAPSACLEEWRKAERERVNRSLSAQGVEDEVTEDEEQEIEEQAAEEVEEEDQPRGGSVVSDKFRARYAEAGHPENSGDHFALYMAELTTNKAGINVELLDEICVLNNINTAKYNRTNRGWQGRLRMTAGNMLRRVVWLNDATLILPERLGGLKKFSAEWASCQKYVRPTK